MPTLRYTCRPGPVYTGQACRHLRSAVPWISEDCLLKGDMKVVLLDGSMLRFLKTSPCMVGGKESKFWVLLLQVYSVVDEMFLAGEIRETSQTKVLKQLLMLSSLE